MPPARGVKVWIISSSLLLAAISILFVPVAHLGIFYTGIACLLGGGLLFLVFQMSRRDSLKTARFLYAYSIIYIAALFGAMIIDRVIFHT
jgi:protoheme IX farnesyltransferase